MPNWCENHLTIEAEDNLPQFLQWLDNKPISFERILPIPEDVESSIERWCTYNWGTKWDIDEANTEAPFLVSPTQIETDFDTAWGPPVEALQELSKMFPDLTFTLYYREPGLAFAGTTVFEAGSEKEDQMLHISEMSFPQHYPSMDRQCKYRIGRLQSLRKKHKMAPPRGQT